MSILRPNLESRCIKYCEEHHIKELRDEERYLAKCIKVPESGIKVKKEGKTIVIRPILKNTEREIEGKVGRYRIFHDILIFVYRDGSTYIANDRLLGRLNMANFQVGKKANFDFPEFRLVDIADPAVRKLQFR